MARAHWGSRAGFIFAAAGSAVGLGNIWRFPYITGQHGGAAFLFVYLICLLLIGFPVLIAELLIGRTTQSSPSGAFEKLGKSKLWGSFGKLTILTGFIVSTFYSAVAGWVLGYLVEALRGGITQFNVSADAAGHYIALVENPFWGVGFHFLFLFFCVIVLYLGVRQGIERSNKILMPCLFALLIVVMIKGLTLPNAWQGIDYLFSPEWHLLTPAAIIVALGQSFFTLSLGQGTMVTYGSYLPKDDNLVTSAVPVVAMDTFASIIAAVAVFSIVFAGGMEVNAGPGLIFHTLPLIFSQISGGYFVAIFFFLLVFFAALTSQISAMEPTIAYLVDERKWNRHSAVTVCGLGVFLLGLPSALSASLLKDFHIFGCSVLDFISFFASSILIPLGGFLAVILAGWRWGMDNVLNSLQKGNNEFFERRPWLKSYFWLCVKYTAPTLILIIFLNALGLYG
jgi:neurotransmitter:Na+ symporter, NSS family